MPKLIILASGNLGFNAVQSLKDEHISYVFTDKSSSDLISLCKSRIIPFTITNPRKINDFSFLRDFGSHWIASVNYLYIIPQQMIDTVHGNAFNIHGALLPKYRGRTPHIWAIINGETNTGITIHKMSVEVDAGDILLQKTIPISISDTGASILDKFNKEYPVLIKQVLKQIDDGSVTSIPQDHSQATYFPKRTPEDGHIDWNWQWPRIHNWIRALTKPYPGAFSFYQGKKVLIWQAEKAPFAFNHGDINGLILKSNSDYIIIKCPNTAVAITQWDNEKEIKEGDTLL